MTQEQLQLYVAVENGDLAMVKHLVTSDGQSLDITAANNWAICGAVRYALGNEQLDMVRFLVEEAPRFGQPQVDVTADDNSAVRWAAFNGYLDVIRYLVEEAPRFGQPQVDVTANDNEGVSWAAENGNLDIVRYLVEEAPKFGQPQVDVTANDNYAVRWAAGNGCLKVVRYLVEEAPKFGQPQVDVTANDNEGVRWAAEFGKLDVVRYLVEEVPFITGQIIPSTLEFEVKPFDSEFNRYFESKRKMLKNLEQLKEAGIPVEEWKELLEEMEETETEPNRPFIRI